MVRSANPALPAVTLRTPRLLLRPWRETDRAEFARVHALSAAFWRPWMPASSAGDESYEQLFDRMFAAAQRGMAEATQFRAVAQLADGRIAGFFSLGEIVRGAFQSAYAGWRVTLESAGQGYATEAVRGLLDLALAPAPHGLGLHRVQANIIPSNAASLRVAEKCGFRREGYALRYLQIAGRWQDHVMFATTVEEHVISFLLLDGFPTPSLSDDPA